MADQIYSQYRPITFSHKVDFEEGQWAKVLVTSKQESKILDTIYEGGAYVARFLPRFIGKYNYVFQSNFGIKNHGSFEVEANAQGGHVNVNPDQTFSYEDGSLLHPFACEILDLLDRNVEEELSSILQNGIKVVSFSVESSNFPETSEAYWNHLEDTLALLQDHQLQAELLLETASLDWLDVALEKLSIFSHIWWNIGQWEEEAQSRAHLQTIADTIVQKDPISHVMSLITRENSIPTSLPVQVIEILAKDGLEAQIKSLQRSNKAILVRSYGKEGLDRDSIMAPELTRRLWTIAMNGAYPFVEREGICVDRFALLRKVYETIGENSLVPSKVFENRLVPAGEMYEQETTSFLEYFGYCTPGEIELGLNPEKKYQVEVMDTWNLKAYSDEFSGDDLVDLEGEPYGAIYVQEGKSKGILEDAFDCEVESEEPTQTEVVVEDYEPEEVDMDLDLPETPLFEKDLIDELKDSLSLDLSSLKEDDGTDSIPLVDNLEMTDDELPEIVTKAHEFHFDEEEMEETLNIPTIHFKD